jgi:hypothetical protein
MIRKNMLRYKIAADETGSPCILSQLQSWRGLAGDLVSNPFAPSLPICASKRKLTQCTAVEYPTGGASESHVEVIPDSEPWKDGQDTASEGKYKYHPYNDVTRPVKESPSALNVVVIPDVTLPKVRKTWILRRSCFPARIQELSPLRIADGKHDLRLDHMLTFCRVCTISTTSGVSRNLICISTTMQPRPPTGSKIPKLKVETYLPGNFRRAL